MTSWASKEATSQGKWGIEMSIFTTSYAYEIGYSHCVLFTFSPPLLVSMNISETVLTFKNSLNSVRKRINMIKVLAILTMKG